MKTIIVLLVLLAGPALFAELRHITLIYHQTELILDREELNTAVREYVRSKGWETNSATITWGQTRGGVIVTVISTNYPEFDEEAAHAESERLLENATLKRKSP